jgi:hypothetical protein
VTRALAKFRVRHLHSMHCRETPYDIHMRYTPALLCICSPTGALTHHQLAYHVLLQAIKEAYEVLSDGELTVPVCSLPYLAVRAHRPIDGCVL